jgi:hypothetical protein
VCVCAGGGGGWGGVGKVTHFVLLAATGHIRSQFSALCVSYEYCAVYFLV